MSTTRGGYVKSSYSSEYREEADERVQSLKARLELVKKRRAAAKQNKTQS